MENDFIATNGATLLTLFWRGLLGIGAAFFIFKIFNTLKQGNHHKEIYTADIPQSLKKALAERKKQLDLFLLRLKDGEFEISKQESEELSELIKESAWGEGTNLKNWSEYFSQVYQIPLSQFHLNLAFLELILAKNFFQKNNSSAYKDFKKSVGVKACWLYILETKENWISFWNIKNSVSPQELDDLFKNIKQNYLKNPKDKEKNHLGQHFINLISTEMTIKWKQRSLDYSFLSTQYLSKSYKEKPQEKKKKTERKKDHQEYFKKKSFHKKSKIKKVKKTLAEHDYDLLDANLSDGDKTLKKKFNLKALKYHPDRLQSDVSSEDAAKAKKKFMDINEAYLRLKKTRKK